MKKQILFLVMILLSMTASAQGTVKIDGICYELNSGDKTAEVVYQRRHEYSGEVVIPSSVTYNDVDYSVTSIGYQAFARSTDLTSVSIPATVTSIGSNIFYECTSLASIVIEEGNAVYDTRENCNAIIETANNKLLYGCMGSTIPDGVASIENSAFSGCTGLASAIIPNSVTSIGNAAFSGCSSMASVNIPNSVTYLGKDAFEGCSSLVKVEINNNAIVSKDYNTNPFIKEIFGSQVEEYILGEDVTSIGELAFSDCPNLTKVHLSDGVTTIGANAFYFSLNLAEINIPASMTSIDQSAFTATGLTKVEINSNALVSKDYDAHSSLSGCFGAVKEFVLGDEITGIGNYAFNGSSAMTINIPGNVTRIGERAFAGCGLTSLFIPKNVTSIGDSAFFNCHDLVSIQVENDNMICDSRENCNALIHTADNTLLLGCQNTTIPNGVTAIGDNAFYYCSNLTSISIPNSVTSIGDNAFYCCTGLTAISIPNSVTAIGENAFAGCNGLTAVNIPNSLTTIGKFAFSHCTQLSEILIPNTVTTIDEGAFFFCTGLTSITIPNSVTAIKYRAFTGCSGLTSIQVESGNAVYDSRENCNAIIETADNTIILGCQNTFIPNSVTSIGDEAFWACTNLTSISIPNSVTSIGDGAFNQCINLASICIPNGVTSIGKAAFADCSKLATIIIPNTITTIDDYAFKSNGLTDMYCYAEQLPEIGNDIFSSYSIQANATLHVPASSVGAYQTAEQWKDFKEIVALPALDGYRTMVKDGKVWKVGFYGSGNPVQHVEYFYFDGDTIIDGKACKQMMCQQYYNLDASDDAYNSQLSTLSYVGAWYEEDKKVYTYDTTSKQFVLKYDFSVEANDTLLINQEDYYVIGPRQTGELRGFKGVYRDVWFLVEEGNPIYSPTWLEGVGSIDGPTVNVYSGYVEPQRFLMSCTVDDEVIYLNDEYEDGATPEELNANKHRFDFTHTVKQQPKAPSIGGEERPMGVASADMQSIYGEYSQHQLTIHLDPLVETYVVCITNESNEIVYEKTVNTVDLVGLNIDISTYAKGCYTATVENSNESFVGDFEVQTTGNDITLSCPDDNHPHAIDLGLPSGTKWACCNVGADKPEEYGAYYAWGETEDKNYYNWNTYIYCDGDFETCHDLGSDIAGTQYDVAHVKWGDSWMMPSYEQNKELIDNCTYEWTIVNGVRGQKFISRINGDSIFLPAAGFQWYDTLDGEGRLGRYWSSTLYPAAGNAYCLSFVSYDASWNYGDSRGGGLTVRPIISGTNNIILSESLSNASNQAIYNIYGIKVATFPKEIDNLLPGIYIVNGKKIVIK